MNGQPLHEPRKEIVDAQIVPPGPGVWASLAWFMILLIVQTILGIVVGAVCVVILIISRQVTGRPLDYSSIDKEILDTPILPIAMAVATASTLVLAVVITKLHFKSLTRPSLALCKPLHLHLMIAVFGTLPLAIVASEVANVAAEILPSIGDGSAMLLANQPWIFLLVVGCIFPAIGEEIYFRGFIGRGLIARLGLWRGMLLASFLFGLIHIDPHQGSFAFAIGIALQLLYLATRSLVTPMLVHFLNNAMAFSLLKWKSFLPIPGYNHHPGDTLSHTPLPLLLAAAAAVIAMGVVLFQTRPRWFTPHGTEWSLGYVTAESPSSHLQLLSQPARPSFLAIFAALASYAAFIGVLIWVASSI